MKRIPENDLERIRQRHERDITHARRFCKVATRPEQDRAALLQQIAYLTEQRIQEQQQLAAAEARATEAAAEAGKWKAEARAHAARCAVLEKADAAPYCEGQCGICDCETAPVAPQQQEGGGQ